MELELKEMEFKKFDFAEVNFELRYSDEIYALISKEDVKNIYRYTHSVPCDEYDEPNCSYISGEITFRFNKNTEELAKVLVRPCYEKDDGSIVNGYFLEITGQLPYYEDKAIEFLKVQKRKKIKMTTEEEKISLDYDTVTMKDIFKILVEINSNILYLSTVLLGNNNPSTSTKIYPYPTSPNIPPIISYNKPASTFPSGQNKY